LGFVWANLDHTGEFVAGIIAHARLYVKADANGADNGGSWADAFVNVQSALAAAAANTDVWVAAGTDMPDGGRTPMGGVHVNWSGIQTATVPLRNSVTLDGGFAGSETQVGQRNPAMNTTILSGDLAGNDGPGFANNGENSHHVVTGNAVDASSVLDGFIIQGGNAVGGG